MNKIFIYSTALFLGFLSACKAKQEIVIPGETEYEEVMLDPIEVDGSNPRTWEITAQENPYQASAKRTFDLLHTKLDLRFDWTKQHVIGKAELDLKPLFYNQDSLVLDAKTMEIKSVINKATNLPLKFRNNGEYLMITLEKSYSRNENLKLVIDYIAKPNDGDAKGSAAITSDKGLFFINPTGEETDKPTQIWTQGETENSSKWFPTVDKPNERCTQEITLTVEDKYITLSNGALISSTKNNDGTRTDYWKQDKPHAPYLFMIAVGDFAVIQDKWNELPLQYIVEKPYAPYAKQIFNHTPEMLTFFSKKLKVNYPWDKYSQIVTRDYVSGAMENTSAVVFGEFVQKTDKELIDNNNDHIVAHEMFHHWFGNLVTTESWSNLTLNEGFANYSEYLWDEYKYGKMNADEHRFNELNGYLSTSKEGLHPLIHYRYANKEDMFDAHSYNKGGLVLHYLRSIVGDEAFYESLNQYLKKNEYSAVEVAELRMAFEDVTGEDMNWFFDQWYLTKGHPELKVSHFYDESKKKVIVNVVQEGPIFNTPYDIAIYTKNGDVTYHKTWINDTINTIEISDINSAPGALVFDGKNVVPGTVKQSYSDLEILTLTKYSKNFMDLQNSLVSLEDNSPLRNEILTAALNHPYHSIKTLAMTLMNENEIKSNASKIIELTRNGNHSTVRNGAISLLSILKSPENKANLIQVLKNEKSYPVLGEALLQLSQIDKDEALKYCKIFENEAYLSSTIGSIYMNLNSPSINDWFLSRITKGNIYEKYELCSFYNNYLLNQSDEDVINASKIYSKIASDKQQNKYNRFIGTSNLFALKNSLINHETNKRPNIVKLLETMIKDIKINERDNELIERYSEF
jgi:aminopeptidase N